MPINTQQLNLLYDSRSDIPVFMRFSTPEVYGNRIETIYLYGYRYPKTSWDYGDTEKDFDGALLSGKKVSNNSTADIRFRYDDKEGFTNITGVFPASDKIPKNKRHFLRVGDSEIKAYNLICRKKSVTYRTHFLGIPLKKSRTIQGQIVEVGCGSSDSYIVLRLGKNGKNRFRRINDRTSLKKRPKILKIA